MLAFVFPGQGSQFPGMGKALAQTWPIARETFEAADTALGFGLGELCFDGTAAELARTEYAQPAILTAGVAAYRVLVSETGCHPLVAAGHSLGEFTAHVCAGTLDFATAVRLVRRRGALMREAAGPEAGAMVAIMGLDAEGVDEICVAAAHSEVVAVANYNGAGQLVISGHRGAVARARQLASEHGAIVRDLEVSAPFHCSLMRPAVAGFRAELAAADFVAPRIPVVDGTSGQWRRTATDLPDALAGQICAPVRWDAVMAGLSAAGVRYAVEVGPGARLTSMLRRSEKSIGTAHFGEPSDLDAVRDLLAGAPWLRRELGEWRYGDRGDLYAPGTDEIVWAGTSAPEPTTGSAWASGPDGTRLHRHGRMAVLTPDDLLHTLDPAEWAPREDGAYVRVDKTAAVYPDRERETFAARDWTVDAAGTLHRTDSGRVIWPDGDEWTFTTARP